MGTLLGRTQLVYMQSCGNWITLNMTKCEFSESEEKFLQYIISGEGIKAEPSKTAFIREIQEPTSVSGLQSFLVMVNQLEKFIPQLAEKDKSL